MVKCALLALVFATAVAAAGPQLAFSVHEGLNDNAFLRDADVAAHLVLRSGTDPRLLIAFPAGDSGVGVWFEHQRRPLRWHLVSAPMPVHERDSRGRPLTGIVADASLDGADVQIRHAVLSSIRVLRDYEQLHRVPRGLEVTPAIERKSLRWARDRLDGAAGYSLTLELLDGQVDGDHLHAGADGRIQLRIRALTGEPPLSPLSGDALLNAAAAEDPHARETLGFLAYREKLLAGSWRFDTYFGRDTLMTLRLLLPALAARAAQDALSSVLERLSPRGEVAHEEDIGERAVLDHLERDGTRSAAPMFDYKMIDGDFLLAPVAGALLLESDRKDARAQTWAARFLDASIVTASGQSRPAGVELVRNLTYVIERAAAFASKPIARNLIGLKPGFTVGDWRDSDWGLGGGHYPYDVNAVLVPAALEAAARLYASGLLKPYLVRTDPRKLAAAAAMAATWRTEAPRLFEVAIAHDTAERAVKAYAGAQAIPAQPALAALGTGPVRFHALALDASGAPIPVMHSDEGFALLFGELDADTVDQAVHALVRPFPAGLITGAGLLVANAVFCTPSLQARFNRNAYHGTVVWSWQQALFAAGLERQLERNDLPASVREHLLHARSQLWSAIDAARSMRNSELWSWSFRQGRYEIVPFGAEAADADESNAAQLWSTVYLAVRPSAPK